jgi:hypothetical protein
LSLIDVYYGLGNRAERGAVIMLKRSARHCEGLFAQRGMLTTRFVFVVPKDRFSVNIGLTVKYFFVLASVA